jgi:hypothetical protein
MRNRTADLLLTMETLCLLSYRGALMPLGGGTNRPRYTPAGGQGESTGCHTARSVRHPRDDLTAQNSGDISHFRGPGLLDSVRL